MIKDERKITNFFGYRIESYKSIEGGYRSQFYEKHSPYVWILKATSPNYPTEVQSVFHFIQIITEIKSMISE